MNNRIDRAGLSIDPSIHALLVEEILPGLPVTENQVWQAMRYLLQAFQPLNETLLAKRRSLQKAISDWHQTHPSYQQNDSDQFSAYKSMLTEIGYLVDAPNTVKISTTNVDEEISTIAGPQLVVPINNARYALNAANARWGSLYDALYSTDVIPTTSTDGPKGYDASRGAQVIAYGKTFLDDHFALAASSHENVTAYRVEAGQLCMTMQDGSTATLANPSLFVGYRGDSATPSAVLLRHNHLHVELCVNPNTPVGQQDCAGISDILLESAVSTIMDCEDSVTAVDAADKALVYRNWLGLMKGDLAVAVTKRDQTVHRALNPDREYTDPHGNTFSLHGRSLMFVRNVGHLMTTDAILNETGNTIPEGIMDGVFTTLCAMHDLINAKQNAIRNSRQGSIYIVKPKMHGPEEVAFTVALFGCIETLFGLEQNTLKVGIMDEERRTSNNLKACIAEASERLVFINTGFLDRTGDEIHTSNAAGPMVAKGDMKSQPWINTYEDSNVLIGLQCGLQGKAQIGKGMWAKPDSMAEMLASKIAHPMAGANTAWVPSPTGATLHALHYHQINVQERQQQLLSSLNVNPDHLLVLPLLQDATQLTEESIQHELDNNCQGILGYVVRWVEAGIGCSKVPDIYSQGLMEDRATLRISVQAIANWLTHGICTEEMVMASLKRMASLVDQQNASDPEYKPMMPNVETSHGFQASRALIFEGASDTNGYTEPTLHAWRRKAKGV